MRTMALSILVDDESGVLSRVAGLFSRRGYNIESLTVGQTSVKGISRMTVVVTGEENVLIQIKKQLGKLIDVKAIKELPMDSSVSRELILIKLQATAEDRQAIIAITDIFRAKIVDVTEDSLIIELTGNQSKLNAFTDLLKGYKILEIARTGITGLSRGTADTQDLDSIHYV